MASNDSEEEDYMSDAFLARCENPRPGLVHSRTTAHKHKVEKTHQMKNQVNRTKSKGQLEKEKREEGLTKAIGENNKGFALLSKMGYKPGMAIGKTGEGRKEPVPVQIRAHREGLGVEEKRKRKHAEMEAMRARMAAKRANLANDYKARLSEQRMEKETEKDIRSSQSVCFQLDSEQGIEEPVFRFYWPASALPQREDREEDEDVDEDEYDEEEDDIPLSEQLIQMTSYLRRTYLYCVWCGTKFNDKEDFAMNCPGDTRGLHDD